MRSDIKNKYIPITGFSDEQNKVVGNIIDEVQKKSRNDAIRGYNRMLRYLITVVDIDESTKSVMWEKFHKPLNN